MSQIFKSEGGSVAPDIETLTGNNGPPVGPDAAFNIDVFGSGNLETTGDAGTNTLTISEINPSVLTLTGGGGLAVPPDGAGNIDIAGSGGITVTSDVGNNRLTIDGSGIIGGGILTLTGNSGAAVGPDGAGNVGLTGTGGVLVAGTPGTNSLEISYVLTITCGTGTTVNLGTADIVTISLGGSAATVILRAIIAGKAASAHGTGGQVVATTRTNGAVATIVDTPDIIENADLLLAFSSFTFVASGNDVILRASGALGTVISWSACVESRTVIAGI